MYVKAFSVEAASEPLPTHAFCVLGHGRGIGCDPRVMESWLNESPLLVVKLELTSQKPFSEKAFCNLKSSALYELLVMSVPNVLDKLRVASKKGMRPTKTDVSDPAVLLSDSHQEFDWISSKF